jgi:hypothetical protein
MFARRPDGHGAGAVKRAFQRNSVPSASTAGSALVAVSSYLSDLLVVRLLAAGSLSVSQRCAAVPYVCKLHNITRKERICAFC